MKKFILILIVVLSQSGCAISSKIDAVNIAADQKKFEGIDQNTRFSISLPASHSGPYASIDQLNFNIEEGKYKGKNASALMGKSKKTETWEVLIIMIDEDGKWVTLPKSAQIFPQL
ncbi:hypothetical protein MNBD_GAMMA16-237 [hydrothermal vent metagenome]|uniref:Uncharacterized protein n=1 Tax=hydrothermal vent metagenome TaxID=652676 RepID=A0A3B0ZKE2_9ZZZZ